MKQSLINRFLAMAIVVLPLLLAAGSPAFAQRNSPPTNNEVPVREILKLQGNVISEAKSARPKAGIHRIPRVAIGTHIDGPECDRHRLRRLQNTGIICCQGFLILSASFTKEIKLRTIQAYELAMRLRGGVHFLAEIDIGPK